MPRFAQSLACGLLMTLVAPFVQGQEPTPLPDPLVMADGTPVRTPADWTARRRPEIKALFQQHVYGVMPLTGTIEAEVTKTVPDLLGGTATLKEVTIRFPWLTCADTATRPEIRLALFLPNGKPGEKRGPVPVFLALNRRGNHAMLADDRITPSPDPADATKPDARGGAADFWCTEYLLSRGYGFATFHQDGIAVDEKGFTGGMYACLNRDGVPQASQPGTIALWAWGLMRAVDYLVTDPDVNAEQIAVIGHSRRGKTALLAGAFDERIALVVPHQSGTGGMALSRDNDQETVKRITTNFPHWFADAFDAYAGREADLPVDQHLLVSLVAPRRLLDTAGLQDKWANYESGLRGLRAADPVWVVLGKPGLIGDGVVTAGEMAGGYAAGHLLQVRLDTKHELNRDYWQAILDYADLSFGRGPVVRAPRAD